jgi:hypothetical protein
MGAKKCDLVPATKTLSNLSHVVLLPRSHGPCWCQQVLLEGDEVATYIVKIELFAFVHKFHNTNKLGSTLKKLNSWYTIWPPLMALIGADGGS